MILALDTSGSRCSAVLWNGQVVAQAQSESKLQHNELLLVQVHGLLERSGISPTQLQAIAVSSGPGSFTGLRVGMAVAKGLCWGWNLPLIAVPTLEGLAEGVPQRLGRVLALRPARAREVYWRLIEFQAGNWNPTGEVSVDDLKDLGKEIQGEVFLCGEGYDLHKDALEKIFSGRMLKLGLTETLEPLIVSTARIAQKRWEHKQFDDLRSCEPKYCYAYPQNKPTSIA